MSQCDGPAQLLLVDVVGGDGQLAGVVEQVVEQDLRRQHRQERQEQRRAGGAEHVAEVARRPHQHVLDGVGEDPAALGDAVGEHVEVLLQQDDVGGVLGDVGAGVDRDADVGGVQGERVVDAVAEERRPPPPLRRWARTMRAFCSGLTRAKTVVPAIARRRARRRRGRRGRRRSSAAPPASPRSRQTLAATAALSPVTTLTRDAERGQPAQRRGGVGLGRVEEDQEAARAAGPCSSAAVRRRVPRRGPGGDGDHAVAGGELGSSACAGRRRARRRSGPGRSPGRPW